MSGQPISNKNTTLRLLRSFTGEWTDWLPIGVFLIRHADGPILVDAGASPRCMERGYFPAIGFLATVLNELEVAEEDDLIRQLSTRGVAVTDLQAVVLTHLHHDHTGALKDIVEAAPDVPIYISDQHWEAFGKHTTYAALQGCTPNHWPKDFQPRTLNLTDDPVGPWSTSAKITKDGNVVVVPTPGHVPGHISVIVKEIDTQPNTATTYFLTGDATYSLDLLEMEEPDGINDDPMAAFESLQLIKEFARQQDVVILPSHDPKTSDILLEKKVYKPFN
ncbi:hypothetical protein FSARC_4019 [Fusarium sarcochroum]|uniref:Metallo-beta-lactamase domain-containing protein n=1 Tax=Fusarium sarcochroum TaxID=1208366 RepID=A0A8H4XC08_9HYPO|nr:hypothetical protein FSARC_4019 [Fusarium sarcochroum]